MRPISSVFPVVSLSEDANKYFVSKESLQAHITHFCDELKRNWRISERLRFLNQYRTTDGKSWPSLGMLEVQSTDENGNNHVQILTAISYGATEQGPRRNLSALYLIKCVKSLPDTLEPKTLYITFDDNTLEFQMTFKVDEHNTSQYPLAISEEFNRIQKIVNKIKTDHNQNEKPDDEIKNNFSTLLGYFNKRIRGKTDLDIQFVDTIPEATHIPSIAQGRVIYYIDKNLNCRAVAEHEIIQKLKEFNLDGEMRQKIPKIVEDFKKIDSATEEKRYALLREIIKIIIAQKGESIPKHLVGSAPEQQELAKLRDEHSLDLLTEKLENSARLHQIELLSAIPLDRPEEYTLYIKKCSSDGKSLVIFYKNGDEFCEKKITADQFTDKTPPEYRTRIMSLKKSIIAYMDQGGSTGNSFLNLLEQAVDLIQLAQLDNTSLCMHPVGNLYEQELLLRQRANAEFIKLIREFTFEYSESRLPNQGPYLSFVSHASPSFRGYFLENHAEVASPPGRNCCEFTLCGELVKVLEHHSAEFNFKPINGVVVKLDLEMPSDTPLVILDPCPSCSKQKSSLNQDITKAAHHMSNVKFSPLAFTLFNGNLPGRPPKLQLENVPKDTEDQTQKENFYAK